MLRDHARTAKHDPARYQYIVEPSNLRNRDEIVDVVDKLISIEILDRSRLAHAIEILGRRVEAQLERTHFFGDEPRSRHLREAHRDIGLTFGQADEMAFGH